MLTECDEIAGAIYKKINEEGLLPYQPLDTPDDAELVARAWIESYDGGTESFVIKVGESLFKLHEREKKAA